MRSFLEQVVLVNCSEYFALEERAKSGEVVPERFRRFFNAISSCHAALAHAPNAEQFGAGREVFLDFLARAEPELRMVHAIAVSLNNGSFEQTEPKALGYVPGHEHELMASASVSLRAVFAFWLDYKRALDDELGER